MTPRLAAVLSLNSAFKNSRFVNLELDSAIKKYGFTDKDRSFYTRLLYGTVERKLTLEEIDDIFERKYGDRGIRFIGRRIVCAEDYLEAIAAMRAAKRMKSNITNLGSKE